MSIKERLLVLAESKKLSVAEIERLCGLSRGSFKNSKSMNSEAVAQLLAVCPDLSAEWLMRGEGDMLKTSSSNIVNTSNIHSQRAHNISNGSGNINETPASSSEIVELLKQQNATLTQQVASLTELLKSLTNK